MEKLNILDCSISHKLFGTGNVIEQTESMIKIQFSDGVKSFSFPSAFEKFLRCEDAFIQEQLLALVADNKKQEEAKKEKRVMELERIVQIKASTVTTKAGKKKAFKKENIAFKCNYCNGGQKENGIGFLCTCSNEMIDYNIEVAHHNWCCDNQSPCRQYHDGIICREELDSFVQEGGFVCYESQMLRSWTAFAGYVLTGENKERPMKLNKVQINSLAILTTREPYAPEADRFVFGVFLVDEAYQGDNRDAGYVTTTSKFRISLTAEEAKKVLFWNYYYNEKAPQKIKWGQGLHRYISDGQGASILRDIAKIKKGTQDEELAVEFFDYFCKINQIEPEEIPESSGALKR